MFPAKSDRPYFDAWLRRTGRQFAVSGRLTETAMALAASEGGTVDEWRARLRVLLEGDEIPSLDLLMRIDMLLAGPSKTPRGDDPQELLF
ncbi:MAG: hypothetical protein V4584_03870 [Verrucomicrobiota bacterium]